MYHTIALLLLTFIIALNAQYCSQTPLSQQLVTNLTAPVTAFIPYGEGAIGVYCTTAGVNVIQWTVQQDPILLTTTLAQQQSSIITPLFATNPSADIMKPTALVAEETENDVLVIAYSTTSNANLPILLVQLLYVANLTASATTTLVAEPQTDFTFLFSRSEGNPVVVTFQNIEQGFAVIWKRYPESNTTQIPQLFIRVFDGMAVPQTESIQVNQIPYSITDFDATLQNEHILIVYTGTTPCGTDIYSSKFSPTGIRLGSESQVNTISYGPQTGPIVSATSSGGFVVGYVTNSTTLEINTFDSNSARMLINNSTADTALVTGGFVRSIAIANLNNGPLFAWSMITSSVSSILVQPFFDATARGPAASPGTGNYPALAVLGPSFLIQHANGSLSTQYNAVVSFYTCQQDCEVSAWSEWSECIDCQYSRTRTVLQLSVGDGVACPDLVETASCCTSQTIVTSIGDLLTTVESALPSETLPSSGAGAAGSVDLSDSGPSNGSGSGPPDCIPTTVTIVSYVFNSGFSVQGITDVAGCQGPIVTQIEWSTLKMMELSTLTQTNIATLDTPVVTLYHSEEMISITSTDIYNSLETSIDLSFLTIAPSTTPTAESSWTPSVIPTSSDSEKPTPTRTSRPTTTSTSHEVSIITVHTLDSNTLHLTKSVQPGPSTITLSPTKRTRLPI